MAFYQGPRPQRLPDRMSPTHAAGSWLRSADLGELASRNATGAVLVRKPYWLAPQIDAEVLSLDDATMALEAHFVDDEGHPVMVSLRDETGTTEVERLFVVSERWPERTER